MSEKVRIGLIGLGFMGSTHFRIHQSNPLAEVVAVADINPERRKGNISDVWGNIGDADNSQPLDFSNVETYADGLEMIQKADIDMVDICIPTPWHKEMIPAALAADKHAFAKTNLPQPRAVEENIAVVKSPRYFNVGVHPRSPEYGRQGAIR